MKLIIAYIVNPIIDKPVANPSNPSVKLTAFENQLAKNNKNNVRKRQWNSKISKWNIYTC